MPPQGFGGHQVSRFRQLQGALHRQERAVSDVRGLNCP